MDRPLVSVVIPAYNAEQTLSGTIESVQAQTLPDWELVVVDDGSSDATCRVAKGLASSDPRLTVIGQPNRGAGEARNRAISIARGRLIKFLDADDRLEPRCLELLAPLAQAHGAACGGWSLDDASGTPLGISVSMPGEPIGLDRLLEDNPVAPSASMVSREVMSLEAFNDAPAAADYDLWLRLARHGVSWATVQESVARYRLLPNSNSKKAGRALLRVAECLREAYAAAAGDDRVDSSPQRLAQVLRSHAVRYATVHALLSPSAGQDDAADLLLQAVGEVQTRHTLSGTLIGDAGFESVLGVLARMPDPKETNAWWIAHLREWWRAICEEGWGLPGCIDAAIEQFAQRCTPQAMVIEHLLCGIEDEVILIGHGANGRAIEHEALARGIRVRVRDDRYTPDNGSVGIPGNAEPIDAPLPPGVPVIITPLNDGRLALRYPQARRWRAMRNQLAESCRAHLSPLLASGRAA